MVFMTYANVVFSYGAEKFISICAEIGIDGLILPDLPFEEKEEFLDTCRKYDVDLISMVAPTSANRIAMIAKEAEGFIYVVSSLGVTGTRSEIKTDLATIIATIRENTKTPCAIGFGISTPEQASKMAAIADGAIVGSAIIKLLEKHGFLDVDVEKLEGRDRAMAVANGLIAFSKSIGAPTKLTDLKGFDENIHVARILDAAKDPQLSMKLQNMPVSMTSADVDPYMAPIIEAAVTGDLSLIKNK